MFLFRRPLVFLLLLVGAVAVPYVLLNDGALSGLKNQWTAAFGGRKSSPDAAGVVGVGQSGPFMDATQNDPSGLGNFQPRGIDNPPQLGGKPAANLGEVFDFRISPAWITSRWSRVTTSLAETEMEGMRVPLVTGTGVEDLHGSLTYYFDKKHRVQRIAFYGQTGNPAKLISLLTQHHGFRAVATLRAGLYLRSWNGKPTSALWLNHAPRVDAGAPHSQMQVMLEINRTDSKHGLSDEFAHFLQQEKQLGKW